IWEMARPRALRRSGSSRVSSAIDGLGVVVDCSATLGYNDTKIWPNSPRIKSIWVTDFRSPSNAPHLEILDSEDQYHLLCDSVPPWFPLALRVISAISAWGKAPCVCHVLHVELARRAFPDTHQVEPILIAPPAVAGLPGSRDSRERGLLACAYGL